MFSGTFNNSKIFNEIEKMLLRVFMLKFERVAFKNKRILIYAICIFTLCASKSGASHATIFNMKMQDRGFDRSQLGRVDLILTPFSFFILGVVRLVFKKK